MVEVILACTKDFGVGVGHSLPWKCEGDLDIFKKKTWGNVVIVGRKTMVSLPRLDNRIFFCLSKKVQSPKARTEKNSFLIFNEFSMALQYAKTRHPEKKIFVAGGAEIYNQVLNDERYLSYVSALHISIIKGDHSCDKFVRFPFERWCAISKEEHDEFTHYEMSYNPLGEHQYLSLLRETYSNGKMKAGRNGATFSRFAKNLTFDLRKGFPLLTGKKMFFRGIVEELLFFLRGDTDTDILMSKGIKIWEKNTDKEFLKGRKLDYKTGLMGPMYGYQLRFFNQPYNPLSGEPVRKDNASSSLTTGIQTVAVGTAALRDNNASNNIGIGFGALPLNTSGEPVRKDNKVDQLRNVIDLIRSDPASRRIIMTTYNPAQADEGVLYPCHSLIVQFYVDIDETDSRPKSLSMYCFNRSADLFLGLPFNIASSALLLTIVAKCTGLAPKYLYVGLGDAHVYATHREAISTYVENIPHFTFPQLSVLKEISTVEDVENLKYEDFELRNYRSYASIPAEMAA